MYHNVIIMKTLKELLEFIQERDRDEKYLSKESISSTEYKEEPEPKSENHLIFYTLEVLIKEVETLKTQK